MAGKFSKFLMVSATLGAAAAATYYYLKQNEHPVKHQFENEDEDFDDFTDEDFEDDLDDRSYVTLSSDKVSKTVKKAAGEAKDIAQYAYEGAKAAFQEAKDSFQIKRDYAPSESETQVHTEEDELVNAETIEEFFDDDDDEEEQEKAEANKANEQI